MTLVEQWDQYEAIIKNREAEYVKKIIDGFFQGVIPEMIYKVWGIRGTIREFQITEVRYVNGKYFTYNKRPTRLMVNEIKLFAESNHQFTTDNIYFSYKEKHETYDSSGAIKFKEFPDYIISKEQAEAEAKPIAEKYAAEEELIKAGTHIRCQRCQKMVANADIVHEKIISIATYGYGGKQMKFCSKQCAGYEQMAHEG